MLCICRGQRTTCKSSFSFHQVSSGGFIKPSEQGLITTPGFLHTILKNSATNQHRSANGVVITVFQEERWSVCVCVCIPHLLGYLIGEEGTFKTGTCSSKK